MRLSHRQRGTGSSDITSIQRRSELPIIELCCIAGSSRGLCRFCTGLDIVVPQTWEGDILCRRRRHRLAPGMALCVEPGLVLRVLEVRRAGELSILTIDSKALIQLLLPHLPAMDGPIELSKATRSPVVRWLLQLQNRGVSLGVLLTSLGVLVEQFSTGLAARARTINVDSSQLVRAGSRPLEPPSPQHVRDGSFQTSALAGFLEWAPGAAQAAAAGATSLDPVSERVLALNLAPTSTSAVSSRGRA
jgi:hypothetical protein